MTEIKGLRHDENGWYYRDMDFREIRIDGDMDGDHLIIRRGIPVTRNYVAPERLTLLQMDAQSYYTSAISKKLKEITDYLEANGVKWTEYFMGNWHNDYQHFCDKVEDEGFYIVRNIVDEGKSEEHYMLSIYSADEKMETIRVANIHAQDRPVEWLSFSADGLPLFDGYEISELIEDYNQKKNELIKQNKSLYDMFKEI